MLPAAVAVALREQMSRVQALHKCDLAAGGGEVSLPYALARKYPGAGREWGWQFVFPSEVLSTDPRDGCVRRHHLQDQAVQRAMKQAVRDAGIVKPATPHTLRHYSEFRTMPSPSNCTTEVARFAAACPA